MTTGLCGICEKGHLEQRSGPRLCNKLQTCSLERGNGGFGKNEAVFFLVNTNPCTIKNSKLSLELPISGGGWSGEDKTSLNRNQSNFDLGFP